MRYGLPLLWAILSRRTDQAVVGARLRRFLEAMGFAYVKMGQYLALRFDILPKEVCEELRKLFDRAAPVPFPVIRRSMEAELGGPLDDYFRSVEPEPVAAASLAQVHLATALDGERLALKVQRPRVAREFEADMTLARALGRVVDAVGIARSIRLTEILTEFESFTRRELDFEGEAAAAIRVREQALPGIRVPAVRRDLSSSALLAMEFVEGVSLTAVMARGKQAPAGAYAVAPDIDIVDVIRRIAMESLRQILIDGLFHADPHPGNILVCPDGQVAYVDFGMYGHLTPEQRRSCAGYIENAALSNFETSFHHFFRLVVPTPDLDRRAFKQDMISLMRVWAEWSEGPSGDLQERHLGAVMARTLTTMRRNGTRPDTNLLLFWRVLFVLDSIALDLSDQVGLIVIMHEFFETHMPPVERQLREFRRCWPPEIETAHQAVAFEVGLGRGEARLRRVTTSRIRPDRTARHRRALAVTLPLLLVGLLLLGVGAAGVML